MTAFVALAHSLASTPPGYNNPKPGMLSLLSTEAEEDDPIVITPNQVGPSTYGRQVILRQVNDICGTICDVDGETCLASLTYNPILPAVLCWSYDISGVVQYYEDWNPHEDTTYYLAVTHILSLHYNHNDTADIKRINSLFNLENEEFWGEYFDLTGHFTTPLTAVYQHGQNLYVRDIYGDYGLVYGYIPFMMTNGDIIYDAKAKPYHYKGINEIIPEVPSSFTPDSHQAPVLPDVFTINNLNKEMIHHYVRLNEVEINYDNDDDFQSIADDTGVLPIVNKFAIGITEENEGVTDNERYDLNRDGEVNISDINELINRILAGAAMIASANSDEGYDVTGFLTIKDAELALIPIKITQHDDSSTLAGDINGDGEENIADINIIIKYILSK